MNKHQPIDQALADGGALRIDLPLAESLMAMVGFRNIAVHDDQALMLAITEKVISITRARPMLAGFGERFETQPMGGHGLITTQSVA